MDAQRGERAVLTPPILAVPETGSTNADLLAMARGGGAIDALWLRAERQTGGRGRQGRAWESPAGNLYASTLVRLHAGDPPAPSLGLVAAVALHEAACAHLGAEAAGLAIKWPNDLLLAGAKLSGILLERADDWVVIGFGVNLAAAPALDRATAGLGRIAPAAFLETLAPALARWTARWRDEGLAPVRDAWTAHAHPPGTRLDAALPDGGRVAGTFEGLSADGALILRLADGARRVIHAGDVFLI